MFIKQKNMQLSKKEQAVLIPITFYHAIGCPILLENLLRIAYKEQVTPNEFLQILDNLKKKNLIEFSRTHAGLKGSTLNAKNYTETILSNNKNKLKTIAKFPFVRSLVLINSLGFDTANSNSDIDLMIICKKDRLAITRDLIKIWFSFIKKQKKTKAGRLAFDLWLDEDGLNISDFRLPGEDIFFDFWLANFTPVFDIDSAFKSFVNKNKTFKLFPNYKVPQKNLFELSASEIKAKKQLEKILESKPFTKAIDLSQQKMITRLKRYEQKMQGKGAIVVSPNRLRFNIPDKRTQIQREFDKNLTLI